MAASPSSSAWPIYTPTGTLSQIYNVYFDPIPNERYLFADIIMSGSTPIAKYYLSQPSKMQTEAFELTTRHYGRLDLLNRFRANSPEVLSETAALLRTHFRDAAPEIIPPRLVQEAGRWAELFSINYWKAALHLGMAQSQEFIAGYLLSFQPTH